MYLTFSELQSHLEDKRPLKNNFKRVCPQTGLLYQGGQACFPHTCMYNTEYRNFTAANKYAENSGILAGTRKTPTAVDICAGES